MVVWRSGWGSHLPPTSTKARGSKIRKPPIQNGYLKTGFMPCWFGLVVWRLEGKPPPSYSKNFIIKQKNSKLLSCPNQTGTASTLGVALGAAASLAAATAAAFVAWVAASWRCLSSAPGENKPTAQKRDLKRWAGLKKRWEGVATLNVRKKHMEKGGGSTKNGGGGRKKGEPIIKGTSNKNIPASA